MPHFPTTSARRNRALPQTPIRRRQIGQRSPSTYTSFVRSPDHLISYTAACRFRKRTITDFKEIFDEVEGCLAWRFKSGYDSSMFMHFWLHMQNQLRCVREQNNSSSWKSLPPALRQRIREDAVDEFPNLEDFENLWLVDAVCTAIMQNRQSNEKRLAMLRSQKNPNSIGVSRRAPEQNRGLIPGFKGGQRRRATLPLMDLSLLADSESVYAEQSNVTPSRIEGQPTSAMSSPSEVESNHGFESSSSNIEHLSDTEGEDSIEDEPLENGGKCVQEGCNNLRLRKSGRGWRRWCSDCLDSLEESNEAFELPLPRPLDRNSRSRNSTQKGKEIQEDALVFADVRRRRGDRVGIRARNRADTRSRNTIMEASQSQK
ncbi:hypothetical protein BofuT4_P148970.1 [Botrytis cinerea T4]|uniref:Uncharacterized protein n=1 Tax=Botryotinia fuckeliana (strain T4) TaxID=999810 RepID=G2YX49_BOTF4|nr:hypothetical protein BofuT4_P148970.1 [Botrytis cinerea T4]